jgi:uncharacterized protein (TIGR03437 family)
LASAERLPLATELAGTRVVLGGQLLPLVFSSSGQVNAQIPPDAPVNASMQLIVRRGARNSAPEPITIGVAEPGIFQAGDRGIIFGVRPNGTQYTPSPETPAAAGDILVIYCTGLGNTNPPAAAGQAVPASPLHNTANPVTARIGDSDARVLFAGLVAGFVGLYQVNAVVPAGISGNLALTLSVAGQVSPSVPLPVR